MIEEKERFWLSYKGEKRVEQLEWFRKIPVIEAEHCYLRGAHLQDSPEMFAFLSDRETMKFITPHPPVPKKRFAVPSLNHYRSFTGRKKSHGRSLTDKPRR